MDTADLIAATRTHIDGANRGALAQVAADVLISDDSIQINAGRNSIAEGMWLGLGLETVYVLAVPTSGPIPVLRGQDRTEATIHSEGEVIRVQPRVTDAEVLRSLNGDLAALASEGLFQIKHLDLAFSSALAGYDLSPDLLTDGVLGVSWQPRGSEQFWPEARDWTVMSDLPSSDFTSGSALMFRSAAGPEGRTFRVTYKAAFAPLYDLDDDPETQSGLSASMLDIPPLGAAIRLLNGRPAQRGDHNWQAQPRRADEVSVGDSIQASGLLRSQRQRRVHEERQRLTRRYPERLVRR